VPLPKIAVGLMWGRKLADYAQLTGGKTEGTLPVPQDFVKSPVFRSTSSTAWTRCWGRRCVPRAR